MLAFDSREKALFDAWTPIQYPGKPFDFYYFDTQTRY
jgi:hypothetical protein